MLRRSPRLAALVMATIVIGSGATATEAPEAGEPASLTVESAVAAPRSSVVIPIRVAAADGLGSVDLSLTFDPSVLAPVRVSVGDAATTASFDADTTEPGLVRLELIAPPGARIGPTGTLALLEFSVVGPVGSTTSLGLEGVIVRDPDGAFVDLLLGAGSVSVESGASGDAQTDGQAQDGQVTSPAPVATPAPVVTRAPVSTTGPVLTPSPVVTPAPVVTSAPPAPVVSSPVPVVTSPAPVVTPAPVATPVETASPEPEPDGTTTEPEVTALPGDPGDPAAGNIPTIVFEPPSDAYEPDPTKAGLPVSLDTFTLIPTLDARVGPINELLAELDARIVGGITGVDDVAPGMLFLQVPEHTLEDMDALMRSLASMPIVDVAVQDSLVEPQSLPGQNAPLQPAGQGWTWEREDQPQPAHKPGQRSDGNWGLELVRVPQVWNLLPAIEKAGTGDVTVGILDVGYSQAHEDLDLGWGGTQHRHGTHVAGTIAAALGNGVGIDGIAPDSDLFLAMPAVPPAALQPTFSSSSLVYRLYQMILAGQPRVINVSMGWNWPPATPANLTPGGQIFANNQGQAMVTAQQLLVAAGAELPLIAVAAGNDTTVQARWGSAMANAALTKGQGNIIVVEALERGSADAGGVNLAPLRASYSNPGGQISAPGSHITSTFWSPAGNYCGANAEGCYGTISGTSMATPHVTGVASLLFALDPSLTAQEVHGLLTVNSVPGIAGASDRLDAFASATDIDRVQGGDRIRRMLLDIDDGSRDGNIRTGPDAFDEDVDGDGGVGDGSIDMSDFRRWRDWLAIVELQAVADVIDKDDVNANGRWDSDGDDENVFPRGDFNGDGRLDRSAVSRVHGRGGGGTWTDLQVLQSLFDDEYYDRADLPGLVDSWDLEIAPVDCLSLEEIDRVNSWVAVTGTGSPIGAIRNHVGGTSHIYTLDATRDHTAHMQALGASGEIVVEAEAAVEGQVAEDRVWEPSCLARPEDELPPGSTAGTGDVVDGYHWALVEITTPNSDREPPFATTVEVGDGSISLETSGPGPGGQLFTNAAFEASWTGPRTIIGPLEEEVIELELSGRVTDPGRAGRGLSATAILLEGDEWVGEFTRVGAIGCIFLGGEPECDDPVSAVGTATIEFPDISQADVEAARRKTVGVGILGCGPCYVRYEYEARGP